MHLCIATSDTHCFSRILPDTITKSRDVLLKCFWFLLISALEVDCETQRQGVVVVLWWMPRSVDSQATEDIDYLPKAIAQSVDWLPLRPFRAIHICTLTSCSSIHAANARRLCAELPKATRLGTKIHASKSLYCMGRC